MSFVHGRPLTCLLLLHRWQIVSTKDGSYNKCRKCGKESWSGSESA
jgi:hypothetical protein